MNDKKTGNEYTTETDNTEGNRANKAEWNTPTLIVLDCKKTEKLASPVETSVNIYGPS